ncbi:MAG: NAD+ synthase [Deltaproteobacteria bacterium]|nr:NAD+ synthase [Deltaproteobacteria bacterium]
MRIALAQINPTVGDLAGNRKLIEEAAARASAERADLVVLPELALTGYPPLDLVERDGFVRDQLRELEALAAASRGVAIALGAVLPVPQRDGKKLANAAVLLAGGKQAFAQAKTHLPTYDVFDEKRYFAPAEERELAALPSGARVGLTVCEDGWVDRVGYSKDPTGELSRKGAQLVANLSASPWHAGKPAELRRIFCELAAKRSVPIAFCNQVGGNDELIFHGGSFVADARGRVLAQLPLFEPAFAVVDLDTQAATAPEAVREPEPVAQLERALVLGIHDYFRKQGLPPGAVIGLSGGIDSALTAHLAVEALGRDKVTGVAMPGPFSSDHSIEDAYALAKNLGITIRTVDIKPIYESYRRVFAELFGAKDNYGLAQQNIQSRIRGATLMAVSNAENRLVLATGNKSELSMGYCTLYGDTVGGIAVIGDVYKRDIYALARHANREREVIPWRTIEKPPSAELAPNQKDSDDLPEYGVLDAVLEQAIEGERAAALITPPPGATRETVAGIVRRVDRNEYKRRQAPLVLRVSPKAFGSGRKLPIVHRYQL